MKNALIFLALLYVGNYLAVVPTHSGDSQSPKEMVYSNKEVDQIVRFISRPDAEYTEEACKKGIIGLVMLQAILSSKGKVEKIEVLNGLPEGLTESAIKAARKIKFKPAVKAGKPVSVRMKIEYNFFSKGAPPRCDAGYQTLEERAISAIPDGSQFLDSGVPIVVRRVVMSPEKEHREQAGIKEVGLQNRSSKIVRKVKLHWFVTLAKNRGRDAQVFDKGKTEFVEVLLPKNSTTDLMFPVPKMNERVVKWRESSPTDQWFAITIGIAEVQFEDGSVWKRETDSSSTDGP